MIFESLRDTGVQVCEWDLFSTQKWHEMYHKIVFRKLEVRRTPEFLTLLEDFIK